MEINLFPKFLDEAIMPVAKKTGSTLSSIWTIAFGGIDIYAEKTQLKRVHALNQFKDELEQALSSIPEEKIIEPPLHIVGPSLEASKYYFENDELRTMFARLIASSINIDTADKVHPAFVEIIKQLSPLDALNLKLFKTDYRKPIVNYIFRSSNGNAPCKTNVFLENEQNQDVNLNSASISNLARLGLISISYKTPFQNKDFYNKYFNTPFLEKEKRDLEAYNSQNVNTESLFETIDVEQGIVDITTLGEDFIALCI